MSKLEELIEELCPDGVEYKSLVDICGVITTGKLNANAMVEDGKYPFFTCDANPFRIDEYAFDTEAILISGNGSQVGHINYYKGKFNAYQRTYVTYNFNYVDVKYLLHYLNGNLRPYIMIKCKKGSVPYITLPMLQNFMVPIPPLPVQEEIVRILDNFTDLTAELQAELQARAKQYEYYKHHLLMDNGEKCLLCDVASYSRDRIDAKYLNEDTYVGVDNLLQECAGKTLSTHVPEDGRLTKYKENDILIGNIRPYLKKIWFSNNVGGTNGDVLVIRVNDIQKVYPRFLYYILSSSEFFAYDMNYSKGAKMPRGDKDAVMKYPLSIPTLEEQKRIVAILDNFDILTTDISDGLPAEIEARKKQYEYYRNKLLTFKELGA